MREHTKKPISRAEAKKAVLKERSDAGGKIMKAQTVYRGIAGGLMPPEFWKPNKYNS